MHNSQETAERIKSLAKSKGISLKIMLSECNLGINAISQMSRGSDMLSKNLARIADYLDCSVDYLLGRDEKKKPVPEDGDGPSETVRLIMECVSQMSPKEQETFLAWLQASQGRG